MNSAIGDGSDPAVAEPNGRVTICSAEHEFGQATVRWIHPWCQGEQLDVLYLSDGPILLQLQAIASERSQRMIAEAYRTA